VSLWIFLDTDMDMPIAIAIASPTITPQMLSPIAENQ
jgi:hypothetical protein